jgi:hypothetical protein
MDKEHKSTELSPDSSLTWLQKIDLEEIPQLDQALGNHQETAAQVLALPLVHFVVPLVAASHVVPLLVMHL